MPRMILDTNVLVEYWRRRRAGRALEGVSEVEVETWARDLIAVEQTDAIVSPVLIEFAGGIRDAHEMKLVRTFLEPFTVVDRGRILISDWAEARRLAERVPPNHRPRDLGDCLIRAIARRLKHEVRTFDRGMPR